MSERPPFPADFLNQAGLNRQHVFALSDLPAAVTKTLGATNGFRQLILLGHGGRKMWKCVKASGIGGEHPIDDYCVHTVARWFADFLPGHAYRILYPGEQPVGLQQLGKLAGWHQPAPFMVGIDGEWGSWFAYRAAILADTDFCPFLAVDRAPQEVPLGCSSPCVSCASQPCIAACPAGALQNNEFALDKCVAYRTADDSPCQHTCLARLACPVGIEHRYSDEQLRHSYSISLRMLKQYY